MWVIMRILTTLAVLACVSCSSRTVDTAPQASPESAPSGFLASSGAIRYMITGDFEGTITWEGRQLVVAIARGSIRSNVPADPPHSPLFTDVTVQVVIAQTSGRLWQGIAESEPVRVASGLDADTTVAIDPLRFEIAGVRPRMAGASWVVVRISATPLPGTPSYRGPGGRSSSYACSLAFLDGSARRGVSAAITSPLAC